MLVTSIFSISHSFYSLENKFQFFTYISSANALELDESNILLFGKEITIKAVPDDKFQTLQLTFSGKKHLFLCVCSTNLLKTVEKVEIAHNEQYLLY